MKDYFAEFLMNPASTATTHTTVGNLSNTSSTPIKHHILWAIVATAIGLTSWKVSQWVASHRFLTNQKAES